MDRLSAAVNERKTAIRRTAVAAAAGAWTQVTGPSDDDLDDFLARWGPSHRGVLVATAALVDGWVDGLVATAGGTRQSPTLDIDQLVDEQVRGGTPRREVLARPIVETRTALANDIGLTEALRRGGNRLASIVGTDVQQTFRLATRERFTGEPATVGGYRRVLQGPTNCGLCVVASTQRYRSSYLSPMHPGCDCGVAPLPASTNLRRGVLVDELPTLDAAKKAIADQGLSYQDRTALRRLQLDPDLLPPIAETVHGELGPLLKNSGHNTATVPWPQTA